MPPPRRATDCAGGSGSGPGERARRLLAGLAPYDLVVRARLEAYSAQPRELARDLERWLRSFGN
ncbi:MAG: hypothetical protein HYW52_02260 [Gemmatimonadetes bacterium]|nr:hypothetical protein [Gemmatimonadota bacterium]